MTPLVFLFWLFVLHFIADFQLQSNYMARNKVPGTSSHWPWVLAAHSAAHGAAVGFLLSPLLGLLEWVAHGVTDTLKSRGALGGPEASFHIDQTLHLAAKGVWLGLFLCFPDIFG